jgi:hypothetical protein
MTPNEIASGRALATAWKPKDGQKAQAGEEIRKDGGPKAQQR